MITVVDYRMGNVGSIANMIRKVGGQALVTSDPGEIRKADKLILPGVGHFGRGIVNLHELGLAPVLDELARDRRVPVLGICLGMQLMCRTSEEADRPGLGWIEADVRKLDVSAEPSAKVPHMGWNVARAVRPSALFDVQPAEPQRFYFVHSYHVACADPADVLTVTRYAGEFCSSFARDNLWGVQFHPEKSHAFGMELFRRFLEL